MTDERRQPSAQQVETYRDAAAENHTDAEVTLLRCHLEVRQGVHFGLLVTDRRFGYLRSVWFRSHPAEWVCGPLGDVRDVALHARNPWPLRGLGALFAAAFGLYLYAASTGATYRLDVRGLALIGLAAITCFTGARSRLVLEWNEGELRHRVAQPASFNRIERDGMSGAMKETARLLSDSAARRTAVDRARARAAANAPAPSRSELP